VRRSETRVSEPGMMISMRAMAKAGVKPKELWSCRAFCTGCGSRVYSVDRLPESSRDEVERLLKWLRRNIAKEHREAHPGCTGLRVRWTWSLIVQEEARRQA
jgi:hypothetical protein